MKRLTMSVSHMDRWDHRESPIGSLPIAKAYVRVKKRYASIGPASIERGLVIAMNQQRFNELANGLNQLPLRRVVDGSPIGGS
jgi:hypothetical protein